MMPASDMIPATYGNGRYLRRWSLIGGHPRCILPPLLLAEAAPAEVAAAEAENARLHALASTAEAYEAADAISERWAQQPPLPILGEDGQMHASPEMEAWEAALAILQGADDATLALVVRRASEAPGEPVILALVEPEGLVANVVAVDPDWAPEAPLVAVPAAEGARAGGTYVDGVFTPPAAVLPVPQEVTLRQLLFALVGAGWITDEEALAAAKTGDVPSSLSARLPGLSLEAQFGLRLTWAAMYSALRSSSVWNLFVSAGVATEAQVDDLFRAAAAVD